MGAQGAMWGGTTASGSMLREGLAAKAASEERSGASTAASPRPLGRENSEQKQRKGQRLWG